MNNKRRLGRGGFLWIIDDEGGSSRDLCESVTSQDLGRFGNLQTCKLVDNSKYSPYKVFFADLFQPLGWSCVEFFRPKNPDLKIDCRSFTKSPDSALQIILVPGGQRREE